MRSELRRLQRELGVTMVYVTHDQAEALALADRIVVMREGRIEREGPPETVYTRPRTAFVARFMGFETCLAVNGGRLVAPDGRSLPLEGAADAPALAWRPHGVVLGRGPHTARVLGRSYLGQSVEYLLETDAGPVKAEAAADAPRFEPGTTVAFDLPLAAAARLESAA
jgi:putative spermidine/putrescine transport system ATP-binding protein